MLKTIAISNLFKFSSIPLLKGRQTPLSNSKSEKVTKNKGHKKQRPLSCFTLIVCICKRQMFKFGSAHCISLLVLPFLSFFYFLGIVFAVVLAMKNRLVARLVRGINNGMEKGNEKCQWNLP